MWVMVRAVVEPVRVRFTISTAFSPVPMASAVANGPTVALVVAPLLNDCELEMGVAD
jgi:hypothetical protein